MDTEIKENMKNKETGVTSPGSGHPSTISDELVSRFGKIPVFSSKKKALAFIIGTILVLLGLITLSILVTSNFQYERIEVEEFIVPDDIDGDPSNMFVDSDKDTLYDIDEMEIYLTSPLLRDSDGDNIPDGVECCPDEMACSSVSAPEAPCCDNPSQSLAICTSDPLLFDKRVTVRYVRMTLIAGEAAKFRAGKRPRRTRRTREESPWWEGVSGVLWSARFARPG